MDCIMLFAKQFIRAFSKSRLPSSMFKEKEAD